MLKASLNYKSVVLRPKGLWLFVFMTKQMFRCSARGGNECPCSAKHMLSLQEKLIYTEMRSAVTTACPRSNLV